MFIFQSLKSEAFSVRVIVANDEKEITDMLDVDPYILPSRN